MPTRFPTAKHVETARRVTAAGGALSTVAGACGVALSTVMLWMQRAEKETGSKYEIAFLQAIQEGNHAAEIRALEVITGANRSILAPDPSDARWWLTHNPTTRDQWSDAASERRAVQRAMAGVVTAIEGAGLTDDQRMRLLLGIQALGIGVPAEGDG